MGAADEMGSVDPPLATLLHWLPVFPAPLLPLRLFVLGRGQPPVHQHALTHDTDGYPMPVCPAPHPLLTGLGGDSSMSSSGRSPRRGDTLELTTFYYVSFSYSVSPDSSTKYVVNTGNFLVARPSSVHSAQVCASPLQQLRHWHDKSLCFRLP